MRIFVSLFLWFCIVSFVCSTDASEGPVVAVMQLETSGDLVKKDQKAIWAINRKLDGEVRKALKGCKVIQSRKVASLKKRYRQKLRQCEDDCDLELARLIGADYFLSGNVDNSEIGLVAILELRSTEDGMVQATVRVRRDDFDSLEAGVANGVPTVIAPLYRRDLQQVDDEVVVAPVSKTPENGVEVAEPDAVLVTKEVTPDMWDRAEQEQSIVTSEKEKPFGGLGLNVGYSFITGRGTDLKEAYTPVIHLGLDFFFHPFSFFEIGLASDIDILSGNLFNTTEYAGSAYGEIATNDPQVEDSWIGANLDGYFRFNVRPTVRLDFQIKSFEFYAGFGMGVSYFSTSGDWQKSVIGEVDDVGVTVERVEGMQDAYYTFSQASYGFCAVTEFAGIYRFAEDRFGLGLKVLYSIYAMKSSGSLPNVRLEDHETSFEEDTMFTADESDYLNMFVRHLGSMNLLTFSLYADMRF